ncbi:hypothetical protein C7455_1202 [Roseicyclus mahoneyensis]|uniref:Uncharacterized protein n=1 Tax=Roseicyclus mahoneyensis TaxID=164332 RepID=A0A316G589_9RHOB|nr:hypothetical protein C7455_1202 [Roseicyclus mahoneyensis]
MPGAVVWFIAIQQRCSRAVVICHLLYRIRTWNDRSEIWIRLNTESDLIQVPDISQTTLSFLGHHVLVQHDDCHKIKIAVSAPTHP